MKVCCMIRDFNSYTFYFSKFVRGRRTQRLSGSDVTLGNAQSPSKATSPLMSGRHVLLKANKVLIDYNF